MNRHSVFVVAIIIAALSASQLSAQDLIYWEGGDGNFTDANYFNNTTMLGDQQPQALDYVHVGLDSNVTLADSRGIGRLRVGHNQNPPGGTGAATLTITGIGNELQVNSGLAFPNAAVWIGNNQNGTVNVEEGGVLFVSRLISVGAGNNATPTGTLNVRTGGRVTVNNGNMNIGDRSAGGQNGVQGVVNLSDSTSVIEILGGGSDLLVGNRQRNGTYIQTDGILSVQDSIEVGSEFGSSTGSTFTVSGGTVTTGNGGSGNFFVGRGASINPVVNISGTAVVNVGNRYLMGGSADDGVFPTPALSTGSVTNHSGGTLNIDVDLRIADSFEDANSDATYNLSGTGEINTNVAGLPVDPLTTSNVIGRRGIGRFIQTGGTANFNSPLEIGNRQSTGTTIAANGLYEISAGDLNVNAPTPTWPLGLSIAPNGTGEFRVVGDDATIDVTGDFAISSTANGNGTLAFELETGDLLSQVNVAGIATFNVGSILAFDVSNAAPTQTSYELLTATSIVDSGIDFNGPAGWGYEIVAGGLGQILRIADGLGPDLPGDHNLDGVVDAADYVAWRKLNIGGNQGYDDFVEHFGETAPGAGGGGQVPEPTAACMLMLAGLLGISSRQCRRRG